MRLCVCVCVCVRCVVLCCVVVFVCEFVCVSVWTLQMDLVTNDGISMRRRMQGMTGKGTQSERL